MATTLTDRAILRLSGEDVRGFLQGLVTNDMAQLAPEPAAVGGLAERAGKGAVATSSCGRTARTC
jgi:folate-binding Fe-S cluster repair protein YgfZ